MDRHGYCSPHCFGQLPSELSSALAPAHSHSTDGWQSGLLHRPLQRARRTRELLQPAAAVTVCLRDLSEIELRSLEGPHHSRVDGAHPREEFLVQERHGLDFQSPGGRIAAAGRGAQRQVGHMRLMSGRRPRLPQGDPPALAGDATGWRTCRRHAVTSSPWRLPDSQGDGRERCVADSSRLNVPLEHSHEYAVLF